MSPLDRLAASVGVFVQLHRLGRCDNDGVGSYFGGLFFQSRNCIVGRKIKTAALLIDKRNHLVGLGRFLIQDLDGIGFRGWVFVRAYLHGGTSAPAKGDNHDPQN